MNLITVPKSSLLIVRTKRIFTALRRVPSDSRMFQHLARLLVQISPHSPPTYIFLFSIIGRMGAKSRIAPHQNSPPRTVPRWIPTGLDITHSKKAISLSSPYQPKPILQPLTSMLRMQHVMPIRSCSKAPGVFSSNYGYPASSPEVHFHRASTRDSFPLITPFVHVGTSCSSRISTGTDYIFI